MKKVYVVTAKHYIYENGICKRNVYENHGIFTDKEKAQELAVRYNTPSCDGLVVEVELNREVVF